MTVEDLKRLLNEPPDIRKEIEAQKRKELSVAFKSISFEDLVAKAAAKVRGDGNVNVCNDKDMYIYQYLLVSTMDINYVHLS
jgi:hypothetical protein